MKYITFFIIIILISLVVISILLSVVETNINSFISINLNSLTSDKVLCLILTTDSNIKERAIPVFKTWSSKCHKSLFAFNSENFTNFLNSEESKIYFKNENDYKMALNLPIMHLNLTENYDDMGKKTLEIIKMAYDKYHNEFKWFLLTDDDTFIFVDHLYNFISKKTYDVPLIYGYNFKVGFPTGYTSGGAGLNFFFDIQSDLFITNGYFFEKVFVISRSVISKISLFCMEVKWI